MKVSKKCVQKMKVLPFLRGKIGRICLSVLLVSSFLCSSVLGTSVSAGSLSEVRYLGGGINSPELHVYAGNAWHTISSWDAAFRDVGIYAFTLNSSNYDTSVFNSLCFPISGATSSSKWDNQNYSLTITVIGGRLAPVSSSSSQISPSIGEEVPDNSILSFNSVDDENLYTYLEANQSSIGGSNYLYFNSESSFTTYNIIGYLNGKGRYFCMGASTGSVPLLYSSTLRRNTDVVLVRSSVSFYPDTDKAAEAIKQQGEEEKNNTNAQVGAGNSASDKSSSDASQQGQTLLAAFQSFVGALTSARPSNCVINMDMGNLDLGNVNVCSISPPPAFQIISSIVLIGFCVPLSVATAKKLISLFRSFQS